MKKTNRDIFDDFVKNKYFALYSFCHGFTRNREDAFDITQESILRAYKSLHKYNRNKSKFTSWIFTIAKNEFVNTCRRKKNKKYIENQFEMFRYSINPEKTVDDEEFFHNSLRILRDGDREFIINHYSNYDGGKSISKKLNMSHVCYRSRVSRIMKKLKQHYNNP
jgi:RNA polymerase sigma-70 factor (ECF subfamily)